MTTPNPFLRPGDVPHSWDVPDEPRSGPADGDAQRPGDPPADARSTPRQGPHRRAPALSSSTEPSPSARDRTASAKSGASSGAGTSPGGGSSAGAETVAREICLRLLSASPRTHAQLADALRRKGVPEEVAERVLARFTDVGLIDDAVFARAWVQSRHAGRGLAKRALASELRRRGVAGETVDEAVETLDSAQEERTARELVARRLPSTGRLEPARRMRRLVGMLARKGYPPGLAYRVVKEALEEEGTDLEEFTPPDLDD